MVFFVANKPPYYANSQPITTPDLTHCTSGFMIVSSVGFVLVERIDNVRLQKDLHGLGSTQKSRQMGENSEGVSRRRNGACCLHLSITSPRQLRYYAVGRGDLGLFRFENTKGADPYANHRH